MHVLKNASIRKKNCPHEDVVFDGNPQVMYKMTKDMRTLQNAIDTDDKVSVSEKRFRRILKLIGQ